jgi:hypothetical protein
VPEAKRQKVEAMKNNESVGLPSTDVKANNFDQ